MARPGDVVHTEPYDAPPTGAPYAITVVVKRSGGYLGVARQLDGPGDTWHVGSGVGSGYKTVRGAVSGAQRCPRMLEDVTYREGFDDE